MKQKKIAFIYHPQDPNLRRLESMPFALNSVVSLAKMGWQIDLYLWGESSDNYKNLLPETVTIKQFREPLRFKRLKPIWRPLQFQWQFQWQKNYCCVFGLGQIGAYIADIIAKSSQCPFIYLNDEFPCAFAYSRWTRLERQAVKNAAMVVVLDEKRFVPLCEELDIANKPYAVLPNMAIINHPLEEINWHERLELPSDCIPFLYAGSIADWAQTPELLSTLPYWPEKAVLILHSAYHQKVEQYRQQLSHLEVPGKVIWSYEPMSEGHLNSLVSYCAGNFALYRNFGKPIEYLGFSSGKLLRSLACGSPVIASKDPMFYLSFVKDYQLGVLVNNPSEIPAAVTELMNNRKEYSDRCLNFCQTNLSFEKAWQTFYEQFEQIVQID